MENKKFRSRLFGFRKSDVCEYIQGMNAEFSERLQQKEAECQNLRKDLYDLRRRAAEMQAEKDKVAGALIQAEEKAREIVHTTEQEAEDKRRTLEQDYKAEQEKLRAIRAEIADVRKSALDAIQRFEEKMGELESRASRKEDTMPADKDIMPNVQPSESAEKEPKNPPAVTTPKTPAPPAQPSAVPQTEQKPKINIIKLS